MCNLSLWDGEQTLSPYYIKRKYPMKQQREKDLDEIVSIIKKIRPTKIYLFGSHANCTFNDQSDIDLLVVAHSKDRPLERRMKLRRMLCEYDRRIGLDLLVYTPSEFNMLEKEPSSFISSAIKQGRIIYDSKVS
jgi:predicted nucleotidyltransferase